MSLLLIEGRFVSKGFKRGEWKGKGMGKRWKSVFVVDSGNFAEIDFKMPMAASFQAWIKSKEYD